LTDNASLKRGFPNVNDSPLAENIYVEAMSTFNFSILDNFKGSDNSLDLETFIFGFREKLRVLEVSDAIMCWLFIVCLRGEACEWYIRLSKRSINNFGEFIKVFLARYVNFQTPRKSYYLLFEIVQGRKEKIRAYTSRFIKSSRKVHNYNEKLDLAAIKKGFRDRGPGTLRFNSMAQSFKTLQQFLLFVKGFMRGEEDAEGHEERSSPFVTSPKK
jgi:Retrotransposon gag protein